MRNINTKPYEMSKLNFCNLLLPGKIKIDLVFFIYSFFVLLVMHYFGVSHKAYELLSKELWTIVLIFLVSIEIVNQITYYSAKSNKKVAKLIKAVLFYLCFSIAASTFIIKAARLDNNDEFKFVEEIPYLILIFVFSWLFSFYSLNTDIRFLFLVGNFRRGQKYDSH